MLDVEDGFNSYVILKTRLLVYLSSKSSTPQSHSLNNWLTSCL